MDTRLQIEILARITPRNDLELALHKVAQVVVSEASSVARLEAAKQAIEREISKRRVPTTGHLEPNSNSPLSAHLLHLMGAMGAARTAELNLAP